MMRKAAYPREQARQRVVQAAMARFYEIRDRNDPGYVERALEDAALSRKAKAMIRACADYAKATKK